MPLLQHNKTTTDAISPPNRKSYTSWILQKITSTLTYDLDLQTHPRFSSSLCDYQADSRYLQNSVQLIMKTDTDTDTDELSTKWITYTRLHNTDNLVKLRHYYKSYYYHFYFLNPLIATFKPQSNAPSYSNTVIGTLAVDEWAVTFGTARRGLGGASAQPIPSSPYQMYQPTHQRPVYQLRIIRCGVAL